MRKGEYDKRASLGTWYLGYINVIPSPSLPYVCRLLLTLYLGKCRFQVNENEARYWRQT